MNAVPLPAELEQFAAQAVATGRYESVADVVTAGLRLLQRAESQRAALEASLNQAIDESERDGFHTIDEVNTNIDTLIEELSRQKA